MKTWGEKGRPRPPADAESQGGFYRSKTMPDETTQKKNIPGLIIHQAVEASEEGKPSPATVAAEITTTAGESPADSTTTTVLTADDGNASTNNKKKPRTEAQRAASRANGALSQGPISPDGKLNCSQNALRHGLRAKTLVLSNEDAETFDALLADYLAEHQPETITEYDLITEMAFAKWRQYRSWITETGAINKEMADTNAAITAAYEHLDESIRTAYAVESCLKRTRTLELCSRLEGRCNRQYHRALTTLQAIRRPKVGKTEK
jgi:hypothetical protein